MVGLKVSSKGIFIAGLPLSLACAIVISTFAAGRPLVQRQSVWSIATVAVDSPFDIAECAAQLQPALAAANVTDVDARFVADPSVFQYDQQFVMFCEVFNEATNQGDIGIATSDDGERWKYERIVLDEAFHLSYPCVFSDGGEFYMVPESEAAGGVRLYRATSFPYEWEHERTLLAGQRLADPTLFQHDGRWWMFVGEAGTHDRLRLFMSQTLKGEWTEHSASPIIRNDASRARPAGQVLKLNNRMYRMAQDCSIRYGQSVKVFEITDISPESYIEVECSTALLTEQRNAWNSSGMHHFHATRLPNGRWLCSVDGHYKKLTWWWSRD